MLTEKKGYDLSIQLGTFNQSYNDVGNGEITIIFLHGFPFDKSMWDQQITFLQSTYRCIALDLRGFGKSKDEETPLSIGLFVDDLILFMNTMHLNKVILCGLSMGGYMALNAQQRFPERFEALILSDTQCIADSDEAKNNRYSAIADINAIGSDKFKEGFIKKVFAAQTVTDQPHVVSALKSVVEANSDCIMVNGLAALAERAETCSTLNTINIPTLIICGREDVMTPVLQSENMHKSIKGSELQIIDEAGHVSNLEQPAAFNNVLQQFLSKINKQNNSQVPEMPIL